MEFQNILGEKSRVAVAKMWPCEVRVPLASLREPLGSWQSLALYVILSVTKDLKVCTTDHRHGDLEILHSVQNDRV